MNNKNRMSKRMSQREMEKKKKKEILHILNTFDFTNYEPEVFYDEKTNTTLVPMPVFALSFVDESVRNWSIEAINMHPGCTVVFA